jgi:hypothetical protein
MALFSFWGFFAHILIGGFRYGEPRNGGPNLRKSGKKRFFWKMDISKKSDLSFFVIFYKKSYKVIMYNIRCYTFIIKICIYTYKVVSLHHPMMYSL